MAARGSKKSLSKGRHRKPLAANSGAVHWLRAGAVGLGLGAAVTVGQATAVAAPDDSSQSGTHASGTQDSHASGKRGHAGPAAPRRTGVAAAPAAVGGPEAGADRGSRKTPRAVSTPTIPRSVPVEPSPARTIPSISQAVPSPAALLRATTTADAVVTSPAASGVAAVRPPKVGPDAFGNVLSGALGRISLAPLPTDVPLPASPIGPLFAAVSGAVRDVELALHLRSGGVKTAAVPASETGEPQASPTAATQTGRAADTATEAAREQTQAQLNMTVGWIPGVGTVINATNLISDFMEFVSAVQRGDAADVNDEIRDMTVDIVGMVPVLGAPLASLIHQATNATPPTVGNAPNPVADDFTTDEDTQLAGNVLSNDTDADGDPLTAALKTQAAHGAVSLNPDGSFTYIPTANYSGADGFTYTVNDGANTRTGTVTIKVNPVNDLPTAQNDTATVNEDSPTVIAALGNDTDVDKDPLSITNTTTPGHGTVSIGASGTITYTPTANYNGPDSFDYTISDGHGGTATATVSLTVTPINDAPVTSPRDFTTDEDTPLNDTVLTDVTDVDGDPLSTALGAQAAHGAIELNTDGTFTYTPTANYNGTDTFTYTVSDGTTNTTGTVTITIKPVNDAPVTPDGATELDEDTSTTITVLDKATDVENDPLTVSGVGNPEHGTATVGEDGVITYTPNANYNGADSFTYTITDGAGGTTTATISVTIKPVNDAPVTNNENYGVDQDHQLTGNVKDNDTDPDGDTLSVGFVSGPAHGTLNLNPDGSFTYNPNGGFHGTDSFTYTITDPTGVSATATANITVNYVAPPPTETLQQIIAAKTAQFVQNFQGKVWGEARYGSTPYTNPNSLTNNTSSPYYTPDYVGECVSLVTQYLKYTFGITPGPWGNADAWAAGRSGGNQMAAHGFVWHTDTSFQNGDILVYNSVHIGIYYNGQLFDSNSTWNGRGANGLGGWAARHAGFSPLGGKIPGYVGYWRKAGA